MSFINAKIIIDYFGKDFFGEYSAILDTLQLAIPLILFGSNGYFMANPKLNADHRNLFKTFLIYCLICLPTSIFISNYLNYSNYFFSYYIILTSAIIFFLSNQIRFINEKISYLFFSNLLRPLVILILTLLILITKVKSLNATNFLLIVLTTTFALLVSPYSKIYRKQKNTDLPLNNKGVNFHELFPFFLISFFQVFLLYFEKLIFARHLSPMEYADYSILFKFSLLVGIPLTIITTLFTERFKIYNSKANLKSTFVLSRRQTRYFSLIFFLIVLAIYPLIIDQFNIIHTTQNFAIYFLLCMVQLVNSYFGAIGLILNLNGYQKYVSKVLVIVAIIHCMLTIYFVQISILGVLLTMLIMTFTWNKILEVKLKNGLINQ